MNNTNLLQKIQIAYLDNDTHFMGVGLRHNLIVNNLIFISLPFAISCKLLMAL